MLSVKVSFSVAVVTALRSSLEGFVLASLLLFNHIYPSSNAQRSLPLPDSVKDLGCENLQDEQKVYCEQIAMLAGHRGSNSCGAGIPSD